MADTLYGMKSQIARVAEIHETYNAGGDMMGMRQLEKIIIEPGATVKFKPGSLHIMMMNLKGDLKAGQKAAVSLFFKNAGEIPFEALVSD